MPKKNSVGWKKFEKFLLAVGCRFEREKGDHRTFSRSDINRPIVFPRDNPLPLFVIRNNLKLLNISWEEFLSVFDKV